MEVKPRPHPLDPNQALAGDRSSNSPREFAICQSCQANLPLEAYGLSKYSRNGRRKECLECRAQNGRLYRKHKHSAKSSHDDSIIRSVRFHNEMILTSLILKGKTELRGFDVLTKAEYKVFYGPAERHGMDSLACFTRNGQVFFDTAFSGISDRMDYLLGYLRLRNVRLEWSDEDVIASKTLIYYL